MKHWLIVGAAIIVISVLLMRSRISTNQTTRPAVVGPGVSLPDRYFAPATAPATTAPSTRIAGVPIDVETDPRIARPATRPD